MATFINTATTGIITTFGKFTSIAQPGLKFYIPYVQEVHHISNKTHQKDFNFRILTKDKVFANMGLAIQYKIDEKDTLKAFFSLERPITQMGSYVENSIRSHAPKTTLSSLYESFDVIGILITKELQDKMSSHGFTIENILMTGIEPDPDVTKAINQISASERLKDAAVNEAAASYTKKIRDAEADRDRKILQGEGVAGQRKAILDGYKENINDMIKLTGMQPYEIMNFILKSQELDTKEQIGKSNNAKVLFMGDGDTNASNKSNPNMIRSLLLASEANTTSSYPNTATV
jgi:regulator of protease activity HflC (stomatin/prohibitin superfamily)